MAYQSVKGDPQKLAGMEADRFGSNENGAPFQLYLSDGNKPLHKTEKDHILQEMVKPDRPGARYLGFGLMDAFDGNKTQAGKLSRQLNYSDY